MKTVIRNSYTPELGEYCNTLVVDKETENQYLFDGDGVWTLLSANGEEIITDAVTQANAYTDDVAETKVDKVEGKELSSNDFTDSDKEKLESVESGAQENIIETVKVNGAALSISEKAVDIPVPGTTSALTNDSGFITNEVDDLVNYYDKDSTDELIEQEALTRDAADQELQEQIDAISAASDVVDIVGTYQDLQGYDTSTLRNNDIIKVLSDSTHENATAYYRWDTTTFSYIGSEGPYYTKGEADVAFVPLTRTINGKGLNSDITLTASDVGALPSSTVIPIVNDATLRIQQNGTDVATFSANSAAPATANIITPTKTSDLTNDSGYVAESALADVALSGEYSDILNTPSIPAKTSDLTNDSDFVVDANYVHTDNNFTTALKNKLDGVAPGAEVNVQSDWEADEDSDAFIKNKPTIPTKTSDLTNDSGYITSAPTKTSELTNDSGFITNTVSNLTNYYTQSDVNGMFNALNIPTKTSDLTNDSGFLTTLPIASASTLGGIKVGGGLSISSDGTLSATGGGTADSVEWEDVLHRPTDVSYWNNDAGYITSAPTKTSDLINDSGFITSAPTKTSELTNDSGFITDSALNNYYTKSQTYSQGEVNSLLSAIVIPTKTSDLTNDSDFITSADLPTVNNGRLTIQKNGSQVAQFTANNSGNVTANITVPTKTSDLTNDSGFISTIPTASVSTLGAIKVGDNLSISSDGTLSADAQSIDVDSALSDTSENPVQNKVITSALNAKADTSDMSSALADKQDRLTAGDHIDITDNVIKAVDYVHSEDPAPINTVTPVITNNMIADGTITADKFATGATVKLTLSTSDIGEGAALAANTLYGVYI